MSVSPARQSAFLILAQVERGRKYAVDLLQSERVSRLKEADRRLATEIVMGVLRRRGELDHQIEKLSGKSLAYFDPEVLEALRLGVYQIRYLENIPKRAAVNESVELVKKARKKSAAGLVNAVLRKCQPAPFPADAAWQDPASLEALESARRSLPGWIRERWQRNFGATVADSLALASFTSPRVWLRATGISFDRESLQRELEAEGIRTRPGTHSRRALSVESGSVTAAPAWRDGRLMIQDEASQMAAELVKPEPGQRVLDLCAAPGLKALQMAEDVTAGTLVACDRSFGRIKTLGKVIGRAWPDAVRRRSVVLDANQPLPFSSLFERVLVDAPCSGTGTLARNPEIKWRLRAEDLPRLAEQQVRILERGLEALAPGGRLVYATCSLEPEENEQVVSEALEASPGCRQLSGAELRRDFPGLAAFIGNDGAFRTFPDRQPRDGFFAVVIMRN